MVSAYVCRQRGSGLVHRAAGRGEATTSVYCGKPHLATCHESLDTEHYFLAVFCVLRTVTPALSDPATPRKGKKVTIGFRNGKVYRHAAPVARPFWSKKLPRRRGPSPVLIGCISRCGLPSPAWTSYFLAPPLCFCRDSPLRPNACMTRPTAPWGRP